MFQNHNIILYFYLNYKNTCYIKWSHFTYSDYVGMNNVITLSKSCYQSSNCYVCETYYYFNIPLYDTFNFIFNIVIN